MGKREGHTVEWPPPRPAVHPMDQLCRDRGHRTSRSPRLRGPRRAGGDLTGRVGLLFEVTQGKPVCWGAQRRAPRPGDVLGAPLLTEQNPQVQVPCTFLMPYRGSAPHPSEQSPAPLGQGAGCRQGTPEELVSGARGPSGPFFPAPPTGGRLPPPADSAEGGRFLGLRGRC